jgi:hypothetical protein
VSAANATTRKYIQAAFPDGTLKRAGRWVSIEPQEGVRQGGPYSCVLAALALVKLMKAARVVVDLANYIPDLAQCRRAPRGFFHTPHDVQR